MRRTPLLVASAVATTATALALAAAPPAVACGGFFCNAQTQSPIIQAGERVLFARHDGVVTMHVEVVYQGDPTQFGWILPVAEVPRDASGALVPLDQVLGISTQTLFPRLQALTDPVFAVNNTFDATPSACEDKGVPVGATVNFDTSSADTVSTSDASASPPPAVVVLSEAQVGPYDAQLIHATRSDALYAWLNDNGYLQDPAAQPLLDHYIAGGFDFIGIRLQNGRATGDIRPLALTLGETAPCVPLRLTQIAAAKDMPILVWVLGDARAVPKNFINAQLNDAAFAFPGGGDYQGLVSQALDEAGHRAWVTELAGPPPVMTLLPGYSESAFDAATELDALLLATGVGMSDPEVASVIEAAIPKPADLHGYPYESCNYAQPWDGCADKDGEHVTTDAEFRSYIAYYVSRDDLPVDLPALKEALRREVVAPRQGIEALFRGARKITRFFALLDPTEMTRDPIFAENPDLPDVDNRHTIDTVIRTDANCDQYVDVTYADGRERRVLCGGFCGFPAISPVPGESPLRWPEVLDEAGAARPFDPSQASDVDALLDDAVLGSPSIPASFGFREPAKASALPLPRVETSSSSGCAGGGGGAGASLVVLALTLIFALRRRRGVATT
ncbi:MAG: DUF2330 domain-containing protein [Deltaproteobacteria bacterium]|nr:DUF2330 domain-containing protein [Deltaproteobacteria bacterium]